MNQIYLTITPFFPTKQSFRGPYIVDQVKTIQNSKKFRVIVLKPKSFFSNEMDYVYDNIFVYRFNVYNLPSYIFPFLFNKFSCNSLLNKLNKINVNLNEVSIAHAHSTSNGYLLSAIKRYNPKIKTILQHHGFDVLNQDLGILSQFRWYRLLMQKYSSNICNKVDLHVGVSDKTINYLKSFKEINIKNAYRLYNGVDLNKFYKIEGLKDTRYFKIGCIANFWPLKDQITLIKAVQQLIKNGMIDLHVVFIGSGATLKLCMTYIRDNKLDNFFEFKKEVQHHELINFYNSINLFVLPSYYEAFGCVYTEAFACGVNFMAVNNQGISEYIYPEDEDKWLIEPGDFNALVERINNFRKYNYVQRLKYPIDINSLVGAFLNHLDNEQYQN